MDMKELDRQALKAMLNPVPASVRNSQFGCGNCLWSCVECNNGSMYKPKSEQDIECDAYTYYD